MRYLFSALGQRMVNDIIGRKVLYAFGLDGMFLKGADDPQAGGLPPELHKALRELGKRAHTVIVSGRTLAELTVRTKGAVPYVIGHHGLEGAEVAASVGARAQEVCAGWKRQLDSELGDRLQWLGVQTDDKIYSLSFGYASDPRNPLVRGTILELLHHLTPIPRVILGRKMVHALPPGLPHKGLAMMDLMLNSGSTPPCMSAIRRLEKSCSRWPTGRPCGPPTRDRSETAGGRGGTGRDGR